MYSLAFIKTGSTRKQWTNEKQLVHLSVEVGSECGRTQQSPALCSVVVGVLLGKENCLLNTPHVSSIKTPSSWNDGAVFSAFRGAHPPSQGTPTGAARAKSALWTLGETSVWFILSVLSENA